MTYFGADRRNMTARHRQLCYVFLHKMTAGTILAQSYCRVHFCAVRIIILGGSEEIQPGIDKRFCKGNGLRGTDQKGCRSASPDSAEGAFSIGKRHPRHGRDAHINKRTRKCLSFM